MTDSQKKAAHNNMTQLWHNFVYEETISGSKRDYSHLDNIIRSNRFIEKFIQHEHTVSACWIFILCDGEFVYFDGYHYYEYIPISLAKLVNIENDLQDIVIKEGLCIPELESYK